MNLRQREAILLLTLSSIGYGCWPAVGLAAEPSMPVADSLVDQAADRLSVVESSLGLAPALGSPAPMQIPVRETDGGETRGHILRPVTGLTFDLTLYPAGNPGLADTLPATESYLLSSTESVNESSALSGSPRQGVMTLDRGYRDAMPGGPPSDHP